MAYDHFPVPVILIYIFTCVSHAKKCIIEAKSVCDREQEIDINQTKNKEHI